MNMFNFESNIFCDFYEGGGGYSCTFNYNITVKVNNGPLKRFFYRDSCHHERKDHIEKEIIYFINSIYNRECDIDIEVIANLDSNKNRYIGDEIVYEKIPNGKLVLK